MSDNKPKDSQEQQITRDEKLHRHLEFLYELHQTGVPLQPKEIEKLQKHDYLPKPEKEELPKAPVERKLTHVPETTTEGQKQADMYVDVVRDSVLYEEVSDDTEVYSGEVYSRSQDRALFSYQGGKKITKADWLPKSTIYHTAEFVAWIDSINSGFQKMIAYKPFQLYCQQCEDWMKERGSFYELETRDQRREFAWKEIERFNQNSLYFLDKYLWVKESDLEGGVMDYRSKPVHKVMAFLFDCGYSVEIGKPRQIAATTTLGGLALCKLLTKKNFFIKMVAQDEDKVEEIFEDKIKFPFAELPGWLYHTPGNDSGFKFSLRRKDKKGKRGGVNSRMEVNPPSVAAINGGAPPLVLVDEAGYIGILGKMLKEARPTMFRQNPVTGKQEIKRQIWIWGTGGEMDKKGKAYEEEFSTSIKKWQNREFEYGIVPLFFDYTTRPGMSREMFESEKRNYTVEGPDAEEKMVQFRQAYPEILEDMFLTSNKTLVSIEYINKRLKRIRGLDDDLKAEYGYFEPIFGTERSKENDDLPFNVIGSVFVPCQKSDPRVSCYMFMKPDHTWQNRYYAGTDPIMTDTGQSKMSTAIWDRHYGSVSAVVNYRHPNHKYTFLQSLLLTLYYDPRDGTAKKGVKDLVESNIGSAYIDYKDYRGFWHELVYRTELDPTFQGGGHEIGIDNRGMRNKFIINKLHELITLHGDNIYIEVFWEQLSRFICKITEKGNETWETADKRKYNDDVLFAVVFAYICALSYSHKEIQNAESVSRKQRVVYKNVMGKDGLTRRVPVKI